MAYIKTTWNAGAAPGISAANLNNLETQYDEVVNIFDAHTILIAVADNTPIKLDVVASRIVGRKAAGNIVALTGAEVRALIGWTAAKLLRGAGAGVAPTEIDVPVTATREFFIKVNESLAGGATIGNVGWRPTIHLNANGEFCYFDTWQVPADFTTLTSCVIVLTSTHATPDLDWTVDTVFAAVGQAHDTHTDSDTADAYSPTQDQIANLDISAALTGLAAGDVLGMKLTLDVANVTSVDIFGYHFKYT